MPPIRAIDAPVAGELKGMIREKENRLSRQQCATPGSCLAPIHVVIRLLYYRVSYVACVFVPIAMSRFSVSHPEPPLTPRLLSRTAPRPSPSCQRCMQGSPIGNDGFVSRRNRASRSLSDANDVVGVRGKGIKVASEQGRVEF